MFEIVAQIAATIAALAASVLFGYAIYLKTEVNKIENDIFFKGRKISEAIESVTVSRPVYRNHNNKLFLKYKSNYPELCKRKLLNKILWDAIEAQRNNNAEQIYDMIDSRINPRLSSAAKFYLWVVTQYFYLMDPTDNGNPSYIEGMLSDTDGYRTYASNKLQLFPNGTVGLRKWLADFKLIRGAIVMAKYDFGRLTDDKSLDTKNSDDTPDAHNNKGYFTEYLDVMFKALDIIRSQALDIEHLLRSKERLQVKHTMPNINCIIIAGLMFIIVCIVLPLMVTAIIEGDSRLSIVISISYIVIAIISTSLFIYSLITIVNKSGSSGSCVHS